MQEPKPERDAYELEGLLLKGGKHIIGAASKAEPRHIRWAACFVWIAFLLAFLASFVIAHLHGLFAAIEDGKSFGSTALDDSGDIISTGIPLKVLFGLAVLTSGGLWFWASERDRQSKKSD